MPRTAADGWRPKLNPNKGRVKREKCTGSGCLDDVDCPGVKRLCVVLKIL